MRLSPRLTALGALTLALTAASPALAESTPTDTYTRLELSGTGTVQAAPDQLIARFQAESRGKTAAAAQQAVNTLVHNAVEQSARTPGIKAAVLQYSVSENQPDKGPTSWTASQALTFTATDGKDLLPLTGELQGEGLLLEGLSWSLSPENQKKLMLEAQKNAVEDLKKQADTLAASLGLHVVRFATVSLSNDGFPHPVMMMAMSARAAMAPSAPPPSSTAETQTVRATANATVLLAP